MRIANDKDRELHNIYDEHNTGNRSKTGRRALSKVTLKLIAAAAAVTAVTVISGLAARVKLLDVGLTTAKIDVNLSSLSSGEREQNEIDEANVSYLLETNGATVKTGKIENKKTVLLFDSLTPDTEYILSVFSKSGDTASVLGVCRFPTLKQETFVPKSLAGALSQSSTTPEAPPDVGLPPSDPPPTEELLEPLPEPAPEPPPAPSPPPTPSLVAPTVSSELLFVDDGIFLIATITPNDGVVSGCTVSFNGAEASIYGDDSGLVYSATLLTSQCVAGTNTATATVSYTLDGAASTVTTSQSFVTVSSNNDSSFIVNSDYILWGSVSFSSPKGTPNFASASITHNGVVYPLEGGSSFDGSVFTITETDLSLLVPSYDHSLDTTVTIAFEWIPENSLDRSNVFSFTFNINKIT